MLAAEINSPSRAAPGVEGIKSLELSMPAKPFLDAAAGWGLATVIPDDDFAVRRQFRDIPNVTGTGLAFATASLLGITATNPPGSRWIRYYGKPMTIPHVSYGAALRGDEVGDEFFRGKIVFIGARPMAGRGWPACCPACFPPTIRWKR